MCWYELILIPSLCGRQDSVDKTEYTFDFLVKPSIYRKQLLKAEATHIEILSCWGLHHWHKCISLKEVIVIHLTLHLSVKQQALDFAIDNTGYVFHLDFLKNKIYNALVLHNCHSSFSSQNPLFTLIWNIIHSTVRSFIFLA